LFVADLMRKIRLPQTIDFVQLTSPKGKAVKIIKDISVDITGRHVLIVEEIIDAGRTLSFLEQRLIASSPASVKIVALLDKPARRELPIKPDYVGKTIDDRFVVGYGMDSEELGRNYKDIYIYAQ
ncbi:MAG: hypoxanthine phosphoribosyltransferase, partial [Bdellovibrionales bacterium]|nr:hypoxanthine phosphoribosyltransferase [Bdellovibrionales bacterium]